MRRLIGQVNTGLSAYQLADPVLLSDITLNGVIQSSDTTSIRRVIGQIPVANVPALPSGLTPPAPSAKDPKIFIPQNLTGAPGETITVPVKVQVTEPAGITISSFDIVIEFDSSKFTVTGSQLGALFNGTDLSGSLFQPSPGKLVYTADSTTGSPLFPLNTVGDLCTLTFVIAGNASGSSPLNLLASFGVSTTDMADNGPNDLVLSPAPTNARNDPVDGLLTIQALVVSTSTVAVDEGSSNKFTVKLAAQPTGDVSVSVARTAGDSDLSVSGGSSLTFTTANWNTAQTVTLAAAEDADAVNGSATITVSSSGLADQLVTARQARRWRVPRYESWQKHRFPGHLLPLSYENLSPCQISALVDWFV